LRNALSSNPRTRIIWAHAGTSGTINRWQERMPGLVEAIDTLLTEHDNLWIDLSWSVLEPHILDGDEDPRKAWLTLVKKHPERFMLGSDLVGRFESLEPTMQRFVPLLDSLPADVARKLAHDNFLSILPARPARLSADDQRSE
jgi:predicted TIM-barrel fold metal-dependent hydrolase